MDLMEERLISLEGKRHPDQSKGACFACTLKSGAAATVFWTSEGTHEDETMIQPGSRGLQNRDVIRTSNTAKSVFCKTVSV